MLKDKGGNGPCFHQLHPESGNAYRCRVSFLPLIILSNADNLKIEGQYLLINISLLNTYCRDQFTIQIMKPIEKSTSIEIKNIFHAVHAVVPREFTDILEETSSVRIERIVSRGHASRADFWYDQKENEFVMVVEGSARLQFEGRKDEVAMSNGDYLIIPAHCRHRVSWTDPERDTVWLAVFY